MRWVLATAVLMTVFSCPAVAQTFTPLLNPAPVSDGLSTALLLTDGTVMIQEYGPGVFTANWWRLTPDVNGSYVNGTWSAMPSLPNYYSPIYYASAVLPDGRVIVEGGEYFEGVAEWVNLGAIFDPVANNWTNVAPPGGWTKIGDGPGVVLPDGTFMLGSCCTSQQALLDAKTLTWTTTGTNKADSNAEEGWTLLPNGKVLTLDLNNTDYYAYEVYDPATGAWTKADMPAVVGDMSNHEIGPSVLRPNGTVTATGGASDSKGHNVTEIYTPSTKKWKKGPSLPAFGYTLSDSPAALLPSGDVLVTPSFGLYGYFYNFYEYNGTGYKKIKSPVWNPAVPYGFTLRLLPLPTGEVLISMGSPSLWVYKGAGTANPAWAPTITSVATTLTHGTSYPISGTQFNGMSQAVAYGDDAQNATNYPLVRITNSATGHVSYARTHDHTSMGVATGSTPVSTTFDVPATIELGPSTLEVVANGIASTPVSVSVD